LSVVADPWNLKLKPAAPSDTRFTCYTFTHFSSRLFWVKIKTSLKPRRQILEDLLGAILGVKSPFDLCQRLIRVNRRLDNHIKGLQLSWGQRVANYSAW
jgi:hypothetical protein